MVLIRDTPNGGTLRDSCVEITRIDKRARMN